LDRPAVLPLSIRADRGTGIATMKQGLSMKRLLEQHSIRPQRGFTLIELMIAVAIVAILVAVALPSYQSSVHKGRRSDAMDASVAVLQAQERFRANNPGYATSLAAIGAATTSSKSYYALSLSSVTANSYTLTAAAASGSPQSRDTGCTSLTITVNNGSPTYAPTACWNR
jgi:type IV pilus assembly protein PilE